MVSWGFAFKKGFFIFLWTILWGILGGVIALVISGGSILALFMNPYAYTSTSSWIAAMLGIMAGMLIGILISTIGNYATIVKITLESIPEAGLAAAPTATTQSKITRICPNCGRVLAGEAKFCPHCGKTLD